LQISSSASVEVVAAAKPQAISTYCTGLAAADLVEGWERDFGIPVYDSVTTTVWKALQLAGVDTAGLRGWGSLFQELA
jgi:maleate isomerase